MCVLEAWLVDLAQAGGAVSSPLGQTNGLTNGEAQEPRGRRGGAGDAQLGQQLLDFWINICVCHSLISEAHPETGEPIFQVSSLHGPAAAGQRCLHHNFHYWSMTAILLILLGLSSKIRSKLCCYQMQMADKLSLAVALCCCIRVAAGICMQVIYLLWNHEANEHN